jgi:hypothetical protein
MKTVLIPDDIYLRLSELAERDQVSVDKLVTALVYESLSDAERIQELAKRGSLERFREILSRAPDAPPVPGDELPS